MEDWRSGTEAGNYRTAAISENYPYAEALLDGQTRMLQLVARKASAASIMDATLRWIQNLHTQYLISSIVLTDPETGDITHVFAPGFPREYIRLIPEVFPRWNSFRRAADKHGTVFTETLVDNDILKDIRRKTILSPGKSCLLTPLISTAGTFGVLVNYYHHIEKPSSAEITAMELIAKTTALAIESTIQEEKEKQSLTKIKKAHKKSLTESRHLKRLLMDAPALIAVLKGPDHVYEFANKFYIETVGADRKIIGKSVREAFPELTAQGILELLDNVYKTQQKFVASEMLVMLHNREGIPTNYYFDFVYQPLISPEGITDGILVHAMDVTQQVNAKRDLVSSEKRFRSMVEQAPVAIALMRGREMTLETVNDLMLELWGKPKSIVGLTLLQALPEIKGQVFISLLEKVFDTGTPHYGYEIKAMLNRNNRLEEAYFNFVYAPMYDSNETVTGVIAVGTEVTNQVHTNKALEASEERFRSFILSSPMPIAIYTGKEMVIQIANNAMLETWGKDSSVIGKKLREALPELEGQPFFHLLDQVYTTGVSYQAHEDRVDLMREGKMKTFYYNFVYKALRDASGNIYGIINNAIDVTPFIHARQKLEATQEQLQIAVESANMGIWTIKPPTNEVIFSERFKEIFGLSININASRVFACIHPDYRQTAIAKLARALQPGTEGAYRDEFPITNFKTGRGKVLRSMGKALFDEKGQPYVMVGCILDITDQKMIERELETRVEERTRALSEANEHLEQFAYVISHDLQEPLRKIRTFSDIIQTSYREDITPPARVYLDKIESSATRVTHLIRDLLDFSKVESNQKKHVLTDLNTIIENIKSDFSLLVAEKNAVITAGRLPVVQANPVQMNQLFYNLIGNSLKFTREHIAPVVDISSRVLTQGEVLEYQHLNPLLRYCQITIRDNGIGFEQKYAETIFGIFQQLHERMRYEGTGTGLAICRRIVAAHQGEIFAEGKENEGAVFHIILPMEKPDEMP